MLCSLFVTCCWLITSHVPAIGLSASYHFATSMLHLPRISCRLPLLFTVTFCWLITACIAAIAIWPCLHLALLFIECQFIYPQNDIVSLFTAGRSPHASPLPAFDHLFPLVCHTKVLFCDRHVKRWQLAGVPAPRLL